MTLRKLVIASVLLLCAGYLPAQVVVNAQTAFGAQCPNNSNGCGNPVNFASTIDTFTGNPYLLRVWQPSNTTLANIFPTLASLSSPNFAGLDQWIDQCATDAANHSCMFVFGNLPSWAVDVGQFCGATGCPGPPLDLTSGGSAWFTTMVTQIINRVTSNSNAFATAFKYIEWWNEFNSCGYWAGTSLQACTGTGNSICGVGQTPGSAAYEADCAIKLYQMILAVYPAVHTKMPSATLLTPNISSANGVNGYESAMCNWIEQETLGTHVSNWYSTHEYWNAGSTPVNPENSTILTTEINQSAINTNSASTCNPFIAGGWSGVWTPLPSYQSEVGYDFNFPFHCSVIGTFPNDCAGRPIRHQLLMTSLGYLGVSWYSWRQAITNEGNPLVLSDWQTGTTLLTGQTVNVGACTNPSGSTWRCNVTEPGAISGIWVWTTDTAGGTFTVPGGFTDYKDLHGGKTNVTPLSTVAISVEPILLEGNPGAVIPGPGAIKLREIFRDLLRILVN